MFFLHLTAKSPTSPDMYMSHLLKQLKYGTHKSLETPLIRKRFAGSTKSARSFDLTDQGPLQSALLSSHQYHKSGCASQLFPHLLQLGIQLNRLNVPDSEKTTTSLHAKACVKIKDSAAETAPSGYRAITLRTFSPGFKGTFAV